jgi:hypothetical protein
MLNLLAGSKKETATIAGRRPCEEKRELHQVIVTMPSRGDRFSEGRMGGAEMLESSLTSKDRSDSPVMRDSHLLHKNEL